MSQLSIVNEALSLCGVAAITANDLISPSVNAARLANSLYPSSLDALWRWGPWKFAKTRAALTLLSAETVGIGNMFPLPNGSENPPLPYCLRVLEVLSSDNDWDVEGRNLITLDTVVNIQYIARVIDDTQWDFLFLEAFTHFLALKLCYPLSRDAALRNTIQTLFITAYDEAKGADKRERKDSANEVSPSFAALDTNILANVRIPGTGVFGGP